MALGGQSEGRKSKVGSAKPAAVRLGQPRGVSVKPRVSGFDIPPPLGISSYFPPKPRLTRQYGTIGS